MVLVVKIDSVIKFTSQIVLNFIWSELFVSVLFNRQDIVCQFRGITSLIPLPQRLESLQLLSSPSRQVANAFEWEKMVKCYLMGKTYWE